MNGWQGGEMKSRTGKTKAPQAIRLELCSISPEIAGASPRDPTCGVGSGAWGLNPWATREEASRAVAS